MAQRQETTPDRSAGWSFPTPWKDGGLPQTHAIILVATMIYVAGDNVYYSGVFLKGPCA
jgi:hypothetical protein